MFCLTAMALRPDRDSAVLGWTHGPYVAQDETVEAVTALCSRGQRRGLVEDSFADAMDRSASFGSGSSLLAAILLSAIRFAARSPAQMKDLLLGHDTLGRQPLSQANEMGCNGPKQVADAGTPTAAACPVCGGRQRC